MIEYKKAEAQYNLYLEYFMHILSLVYKLKLKDLSLMPQC